MSAKDKCFVNILAQKTCRIIFPDYIPKAVNLMRKTGVAREWMSCCLLVLWFFLFQNQCQRTKQTRFESMMIASHSPHQTSHLVHYILITTTASLNDIFSFWENCLTQPSWWNPTGFNLSDVTLVDDHVDHS